MVKIFEDDKFLIHDCVSSLFRFHYLYFEFQDGKNCVFAVRNREQVKEIVNVLEKWLSEN